MKTPLLHDIEFFLRETGMGAAYFGARSCGNSHLVRRLSEGKSVLLTTESKIRDFMAVYRHTRAPLPKTRGSNSGVAAS